MLLSPSDIKSMHRYDALLEQQMGNLARENSRLSDENDTLRKDVKLLKAKGGEGTLLTILYLKKSTGYKLGSVWSSAATSTCNEFQ